MCLCSNGGRRSRVPPNVPTRLCPFNVIVFGFDKKVKQKHLNMNLHSTILFYQKASTLFLHSKQCAGNTSSKVMRLHPKMAEKEGAGILQAVKKYTTLPFFKLIEQCTTFFTTLMEWLKATTWFRKLYIEMSYTPATQKKIGNVNFLFQVYWLIYLIYIKNGYVNIGFFFFFFKWPKNNYLCKWFKWEIMYQNDLKFILRHWWYCPSTMDRIF